MVHKLYLNKTAVQNLKEKTPYWSAHPYASLK